MSSHVRLMTEHVAWVRYIYKHGAPTRIVLCDSDAEGAFKVFRSQTVADDRAPDPGNIFDLLALARSELVHRDECVPGRQCVCEIGELMRRIDAELERIR